MNQNTVQSGICTMTAHKSPFARKHARHRPWLPFAVPNHKAPPNQVGDGTPVTGKPSPDPGLFVAGQMQPEGE